MSAAPDTARELTALRRLIAEAAQLGARFRISGAEVLIDNLNTLPDAISDALLGYAAGGWLYPYLGGEQQDAGTRMLRRQIDVEPILVESREAARIAVRRLMVEASGYGGHLGLDIETAPKPGYGQPRPAVEFTADGRVSDHQPQHKDRAGLDPHRADIQCLQLYAGGERCFVFRGAALQLVLGSHWLRRQRLAIHNALFETMFVAHQTGYCPPPGRKAKGRIACTMQGAGLLLGVHFTGGRSLATAAQHFLGFDVSKELQTSDWAAPHLSPGQLAYAACDAVLAWRLWPIIARGLRRKGRWDAYTLQRRAIPAVADMQLRGLALDRDEHRRQCATWAAELTAARREYHALTSRPPPSKPAEVRDWLAAVLPADRLARWPRTPTGELSISSLHLKRLGAIPSARPVLAILAKEKLLTTFGPRLAEFINPVTRRIHCDYNLAASKAGRFSAAHPNLQQLPNASAPGFKACIVADPGNVLVGCDWSQIEMRAAAWISKDAALSAVYAEGRDLHAETASRIAGVPLAAVAKGQRQAAKPVNFGAIYGIGPASLAASAFADYGVEMDLREAQHALDQFFAGYPQLARWRRDHADLCQARGYVAIGAGRVVEAAWEPGGRLSFPQCCNLPVQGAAADAMLRAIPMAHARLKRAGIRGGLVATVHDELLLEVAEADAERARGLLESTMIEAFKTTFPGAPTTGVAKAVIGRNWAEVRA